MRYRAKSGASVVRTLAQYKVGAKEQKKNTFEFYVQRGASANAVEGDKHTKLCHAFALVRTGCKMKRHTHTFKCSLVIVKYGAMKSHIGSWLSILV